MSSLCPVGWHPVFAGESIATGINREQLWHAYMARYVHAQQGFFFRNIGLVYHAVAHLSLMIPGLNVFIYLTTYLALSILRPSHFMQSYQTALSQYNLAAAYLCVQRGMPPATKGKEGKSYQDFLIEEMGKSRPWVSLEVAIRDLPADSKVEIYQDALSKKNLKGALMCVHCGVPPEHTDSKGKTVFDYLAKEITKATVSISSSGLTAEDCVPLYRSALKGGYTNVALACSANGVSPSEVDGTGKNLLDHLAIASEKQTIRTHLDKAYELILAGVEVHEPEGRAMRNLFFLACAEKKYPVIAALLKAGVTPASWKKAHQALMGPKPLAVEEALVCRALSPYLTDISEQAERRVFSPFTGYQGILLQVARQFNALSKHHVALIGAEGVGKTALVQQFASLTLTDTRFPYLLGKHVVKLNIQMLSTAPSEEMTLVAKFLTENVAQIVIYIEDVQDLLEDPTLKGLPNRLASTFKECLSLITRLKIPCLLCCREDSEGIFWTEPTVKRHFVGISVPPPGGSELFAILQAAKKPIEEHFDITLRGAAIAETMELCERFLPSSAQPQIGIEILERAAQILATEKTEGPFPLRRKLLELEQLRFKALHRSAYEEEEKGAGRQIEVLEEEVRPLETHRPQLIQTVHLNAQLNFLRAVEVGLESEEEISVTSLLEHPSREVERLREELDESIGRAEVEDIEAVRQAVSDVSKVPVSRLSEGQATRLLNAAEFLGTQVLGQPHAIEIVSRAIQTAGAHLSSESRPLGTFLFVGSSAVGKTKLAQSIAELVFGSKKAVTFIPMGQYQEKHNVSNLTGVPPGYVGSEEEGYLTRILRKNPQGVLIFDEAEKAHACFWDLLLTICDEGYYKDTSTGRKVDCRNVFVILTSNLGSRDFLQNLDSALSRREEGKRSHASREPSLETLCSIESVRETFLPAVKRFFRPEFLGRVKVIPFVPLLDPKLLITIATAHLEQEKAYLASGRHKLQLTWDEDMTHYLGLLGKDPSVGVRPIRDCLERDMRGLLSELILSGKVRAGNTVQYTLDHSEQPTLRIVEL